MITILIAGIVFWQSNKTEFCASWKEKSTNEKEEIKTIDIADILKSYKTENSKIGIDVSKWQEEIDWQKVKNAVLNLR